VWQPTIRQGFSLDASHFLHGEHKKKRKKKKKKKKNPFIQVWVLGVYR
jgi:hypothetical protein